MVKYIKTNAVVHISMWFSRNSVVFFVAVLMASVSVYPRPKKQAKDQDTTERLQASRVRNQKGANFQNLVSLNIYAMVIKSLKCCQIAKSTE